MLNRSFVLPVRFFGYWRLVDATFAAFPSRYFYAPNFSVSRVVPTPFFRIDLDSVSFWDRFVCPVRFFTFRRALSRAPRDFAFGSRGLPVFFVIVFGEPSSQNSFGSVPSRPLTSPRVRLIRSLFGLGLFQVDVICLSLFPVFYTQPFF